LTARFSLARRYRSPLLERRFTHLSTTLRLR
jgi:hypothetical protein